MPVITPKSPEVLQAQAAGFAAECDGYGDGRDLVQAIGCTAGLPVAFDTKPSERKYEESAREKEYLEFLRSNDGRSASVIEGRADMIARYEEFAPAVDALMAELEKGWLTHPSFLGMGNTSNAFRLEHEGQSYAVRMPSEEGFGIDREYIAPSVAAKGKKGMEQMVALSYEDGITISEFIPGKNMDLMEPDEVTQIPDEHLEGFVEIIRSVQESGLLIDSNAANVLYDPEEGFGFIDLSHSKYPGGPVLCGADMASMIMLGGDLLMAPMHRDEQEIEGSDAAAESKEAVRELHDLAIPILERYKAICLRKFADHQDFPEIEENLEQRLGRLIEYRDSLIDASEQSEDVAVAA